MADVAAIPRKRATPRPKLVHRFLVHGYAECLQIIADPDHEEHESTLQWAGGNIDPEAFDPAAVKFDDPKKRWKKAFGHRP